MIMPLIRPATPSLRFLGNTPEQPAKADCPSCDPKNETPAKGETPAVQGKKPSKANTYVTPRPRPLLMRLLGPVNRSLILKGLPVMRNIPDLNKLPLGHGLLKVTKIDFPATEVAELKKYVNPKTAAFMGPNHPRFFADWMFDKEVSTRVAPQMASWADKGIVNGPGQKFWLWNNLISNVGEDEGGKGKEYSIEWALKGKGVLLHPEGTVYWTGNKIHKLFAGIVEMPMRAAKMILGGKPEDKRPVFSVPLVWKVNFTKDISKALHKQMAYIEKKLQIEGNPKSSVIARFVNLQSSILSNQEAKFGLPEAQRKEPLTAQTFFDRQEAFFQFLLQQLEAKYGQQEGPDGKKLARLGKKIDAEKATDRESYKAGMSMLAEARRLQGFTREVYNNPKLSQEEVEESLQRIRQKDFGYNGLVDKKDLSMRDQLYAMVPIPSGPNEVHIRVAGPAIEFTQLMEPPPENEDALQEKLVDQIKGQMQAKLDEINKEIEPVVSKFAKENPFYGVKADKPVAQEPTKTDAQLQVPDAAFGKDKTTL